MHSRRASRAGRTAGALVGMLLFSTALSAQTLSLPTFPSAEPPEDDQGALVSAAQRAAPAPESRPRPWDYRLGMGVGYDSNIEFLVPGGPGSLALSPRGDLQRLFWSPRGQLRVRANAGCVGYTEQRDLSRPLLAFDLDGRYLSSPVTTLWGRASYDFGYSDSSQVLADQGVLLPLMETRTASAAAGAIWRVGRRTSLSLEGRFHGVNFNEETPGSAALVDGRSLRGMAGLTWRIGPRATTTLEYSLESDLGRHLRQGEAGGGEGAYLTHFGSLQWAYLLSSSNAFKVEAGSSYTPAAAQAGLGQRANFYGGAAYVRRVKRSNFVLFARREVTPAFGLGVNRVESRFGIFAWIVMGRDWTLELNGSHVNPTNPEGTPVVYATSDEAYASLRRRLGHWVELSTEARYRRRSAVGSLPEVDSLQAGVYLSFVSPRDFTLPPPERY